MGLRVPRGWSVRNASRIAPSSKVRRTAISVTTGSANPTSGDNNVGEPASTGDTGAAGAGLVDAFAAFQQL